MMEKPRGMKTEKRHEHSNPERHHEDMSDFLAWAAFEESWQNFRSVPQLPDVKSGQCLLCKSVGRTGLCTTWRCLSSLRRVRQEGPDRSQETPPPEQCCSSESHEAKFVQHVQGWNVRPGVCTVSDIERAATRNEAGLRRCLCVGPWQAQDAIRFRFF